jgi:hypothetical protein
MSRKERWIWVGLAALAALALLFLARAVGAVDMTFMPKGGRALAAQAFGADDAALRAAMSARRSESEWGTYLASRGLSDRDRTTLAAYLAAHAPLPAGAAKGPIAQSLPRDGRDIAWSECQSCHTLSHAMLTQTRDADGWRKLLASPSHRGVKLAPAERDEVARYAALHMPMKMADVPASMR